LLLLIQGEIQEEITSPFINKRAVVLRDFTERPESVQSGHSILCKADKFHILGAIRKLEIMDPQPENTCPYGSGKAAEVIIDILKKSYLNQVNQKKISRT
jgi:UDP-N-acetylglucosamine 2-epimerase (non-hydrolysing)